MIPTQRTQVPFSRKTASSTSSKARVVPKGHCSPERTVRSPQPFTVHTTTNHASIKGANPKYFLPDLTIAITLQEYSATQDAYEERMISCGPEPGSRDLILLSRLGALRQPPPVIYWSEIISNKSLPLEAGLLWATLCLALNCSYPCIPCACVCLHRNR